MLGAIAGDIIGSVYENFRTKRKDFTLFTPVSTFGYYKEIPLDILRQVRRRLAKPLWKTTADFYAKFGVREIIEQLGSLEEG